MGEISGSPKPYLSPMSVTSSPRVGLTMVLEGNKSAKKTKPTQNKVITKGKSGAIINQREHYEKNTATRR